MTYAYLCIGRDAQGRLELDNALAPSEEAVEENIDRANARAMEQMMQAMGAAQIGPPRRRPGG